MNKAISANDPQALEKLTDKLNKCKELQETMKAVNAYWRKHGTCIGAPVISAEQCREIDKEIADPQMPMIYQPFASYALTNNNSEIKRLEKRIAEITRNKEVGFNGWTFDGGEAVINKEINRLQLQFDERPDKEQCSMLKRCGFHWSPTEKAWQRQLTSNAIYAAGRIDFIKPDDGRTVREHQPKIPQKNMEVR